MIGLISILAVVTITYLLVISWVIVGFKKSLKNATLHEVENINKVSVIVPFRNEETNLVDCLNSLQNQDLDKDDYEIILVNDHSSDNSLDIAKKFVEQSNINFKLISLNENSSKKEALKEGIELAVNPIIATVDADCVVPKKWINNIATKCNTQTDMMLGPVMFKQNKGLLSAFQTLDMLAIQGVEFGALGFNHAILNNAANLAYQAKALSSVNGFDSFKTPSGDDIFLLEKFKSHNKNIKGLLSADFIVETEPESSLTGFLNQRIRWSSKSKYYTDKVLIFFSGLVLVQNMALWFIYGGLAFAENHRLSFLILLLTKWLIDFILLFLVAGFFKRKNELFYFIPVQLIYPIYIVVVSIASVIIEFDWKGRKY